MFQSSEYHIFPISNQNHGYWLTSLNFRIFFTEKKYLLSSLLQSCGFFWGKGGVFFRRVKIFKAWKIVLLKRFLDFFYFKFIIKS